jgi:lambda repressor-like predicted transcriptional regulator
MGKKRVKKRIKYIKSQMMLNDVTLVGIARKLKVSRTWVSLVLNEHAESPRVRKAIAEALGKQEKDLWPEEKKAA